MINDSCTNTLNLILIIMLMFELNNNMYVMYYSNINTLTNINKFNIIKYIYDYLIQIHKICF